MKNKQNIRKQYTHPHVDTLKQARRRQQLAADIAAKGITDEYVLDAISSVPRHLFMPVGMEDDAYVDRAFPIGEGQTISQPYTVAYQTQLLNVQPHDKILEVGTGSAYQAAILAEMGAEVYTIERQKIFYDRNMHFQFLRSFPNLHFCYGDGFKGWPAEAPFDKILITAAPEELPIELTEQLRIGGILVAPVGKHGNQRMIRVTRQHNGQLQEEVFDYFSFVPMLKGKV
ncbi:protein-L-isoaspartate(D-aspartate) O-methyltransferase [Niastella sp. OAS944]|uniref:protein-L-isoaspartate(D-aspartate) O-methyltransferase n=1 Tax=Niastella sp. OAS944 TaxID=2664089 RepID=UPI00346BEC86|nr:protein-L-isoaspartate(D-aspartate) O-methyltransferase [Chitinophagaceae bacterium OAS944]